MSQIEQPNARYKHVYPVIRIDLPPSENQPEDSIAVVKVFESRVSAEREAERLNELNRDKNCKYVVYTSRLIESVG